MEHTIKIEKELKITTQDITDYVLCCEAGGFDYWAELCTDEADYAAAKSRLLENADGETVNLLTAVYIIIMAGFLFYAKEVLVKLVTFVKGRLEVGELTVGLTGEKLADRCSRSSWSSARKWTSLTGSTELAWRPCLKPSAGTIKRR